MKLARIIGLSLFGAVILFAVTIFFTSPGKVWMDASVLHGSASEEMSFDLAIKEVSLQKVDSKNLKENSYIANLTLHNNGSAFLNQQVLAHIEPIKSLVVLSREDGNFSMKEDEDVVQQLAFSLPSNVAELNLEIYLEALTFVDENSENDKKSLLVENDVTGIDNFRIDSVDANGLISFNWKNLQAESDENIKLMLAYTDKIQPDDATVLEASDSSFSYQSQTFKHKTITELSFKEHALVDGKSLQLDWNPWEGSRSVAVVLQVSDKQSEAKIFSDILYIQPLQKLTRAELARLVVDALNLNTNKNVMHFYQDVSDTDWFAPYVQTLYGEGALDDEAKFRPEETATRRDFARIISRIFQLPYSTTAKYNDISELDEDFYAIGSLKNIVDLWEKKENFTPDNPMIESTAKDIISTLKSKAEID